LLIYAIVIYLLYFIILLILLFIYFISVSDFISLVIRAAYLCVMHAFHSPLFRS